MHEHGVLTDTEAEAALEGKATEPVEVPGEPQPLSLVVTEEVSQTAVLGLQITVQSSRLSIHGLTQERHERAFEVAVALQKLVPHSPTHSMGFNRNFVLEIGSEEAWHRIGHTIIQKNDFWLANGELPGTASSAVRYRSCNVEQAQLNLVIGPVLDISDWLVRVNCNYHFDGAALNLQESAKEPRHLHTRALQLSDFDVVLSSNRWAAMRTDAFAIAERVHDLGK